MAGGYLKQTSRRWRKPVARAACQTVTDWVHWGSRLVKVKKTPENLARGLAMRCTERDASGYAMLSDTADTLRGGCST